MIVNYNEMNKNVCYYTLNNIHIIISTQRKKCNKIAYIESIFITFTHR